MARVLISAWIGACGLVAPLSGTEAEVLFDATVNRDTPYTGRSRSPEFTDQT